MGKKEKDKEEKERLNRYGDLVCDFANAKTTDEACLKHFDNIESLLPGPQGSFSQKAKKAFPSLTAFDAPLKIKISEIELLDLIYLKKKIQRELKNEFLKIGYMFPGPRFYDPNTEMLELCKCSENTDFIDGQRIVIQHFEKREQWPLGEFMNKFLNPSCPMVGRELSSHIGLKLEKFVHIVEQIARSPIAKHRVEKLDEVSDQYARIVILHNRIIDIQQAVRNVLDNIIQDKRLNEIAVFMQFLERYPAHDRPEEWPPVIYVNVSRYLEHVKRYTWWRRLQDDLIYFLIELLRTEGARNLVHKCNKCGGFFIRSKDDKRFIYCRACSPKDTRSPEKKAEQQRKWRRKQKALKEQQRHEARVENYMKNLDCTREEAEAIIATDRELEKSV